MNFIGKNTDYNERLKALITVNDYTIVSYLDNFQIENVDAENLIQILPVNDSDEYYDAHKKVFAKGIENYLFETKCCTSIFVYMHEYVDPEVIANVINTFDKDILVDSISIYPKISDLKLRNNEVSELPWQKKINGTLS